MTIRNLFLCISVSLALCITCTAQVPEIQAIPAGVNFSLHLQEWDGFGFNYVETAQTRDYGQFPQDYGGFSLLNPESKQQIADLIFGENGLKIQIVKMFLDPYHQACPDCKFDHETTTQNMREFVRLALETTKARGDSLEIITTLYGPPAWATVQKHIGGRDLDTSQAMNLCYYMADWINYLTINGYPVKNLSMHNEGEDFYRWNYDVGSQRFTHFDFNMYWPPAQVNRFLKLLPSALGKYGLSHIGLTNGEPSNWTRFYFWGYAHALAHDTLALHNLKLLTSHGFINGNATKLSYGTANSLTKNMLSEEKPQLHAWVTSCSWGNPDFDFMRIVHENIYSAKVNALIPWAGIQNPQQWIDGDPNPGCPVVIDSTGTWKTATIYYLYKQLTRAGQRGMAVAEAFLASPAAHIIAFAGKNSGQPDAFVLTSDIKVWGLPIDIAISGTNYTRFSAFRTSRDGTEQYKHIGIFETQNGILRYDPPVGTVTTFFGID